MSTPVNQWDFAAQHVDNNAMVDPTNGNKQGNYISSESIVLAAGPATYKSATDSTFTNLYTIGVCDTIQVTQNKGVIQLYEIGSRIPYLIPGRPVTEFRISRVLFNGDSLLASLTQANGDSAANYEVDIIGKPGEEFQGSNQDSPSNFYFNLASHFFNKPFGLALFFKDSENQWVAGFYAENCVIQQHSMAIQGQNMVVMENASVRCTAFVPLKGSPGGTPPKKDSYPSLL